MRRFFKLALLIGTACTVHAANVTVALDSAGRTTGTIPVLRAGDSLEFRLPSGTTLTYLFSGKIGNGYRLDCENPKEYAPSGRIPIVGSVDAGNGSGKQTKAAALYFNLTGPADPDRSDQAQLDDLQAQVDYYTGLSMPLSWSQKKAIQDDISGKNGQISQLQEEIKAYTGMSIAEAVQAIDRRQGSIRDLRVLIKSLQKQLDGSSLQDQIKQLEDQRDALAAKIALDKKVKLLRAGVLLIGEQNKAVYYTVASSADASNQYFLKHFQPFPVFTTDDVPYVVILAQQNGAGPQGLRASFTSQAGSYIDVNPVRPVVTQQSFVSGLRKTNKPAPCLSILEDALVDYVLPLTDRLKGETVYSVTVTGYGVATTTDQLTVTTGDTSSTQHQVVTSTQDLKLLDAEAWPQVHSLYHYNVSTGVLWTSVRAPSFSRVATGGFLQPNCDPATSMTPCTPLYHTLKDSGGPRVLPALFFTFYPFKRDTQVPVKWKEMIPAPAFGLSLMNPTDDFFIGGSSELKFLRNVQLVYGLHLGRVDKLGANSFQLSTDMAAPLITKTLQKGVYMGLTFNIDFVKALFGK